MEIDPEVAVMDNLNDLEDGKWWKRLLTRWDNLSLGTKKVIVRVGTARAY